MRPVDGRVAEIGHDTFDMVASRDVIEATRESGLHPEAAGSVEWPDPSLHMP